MQENIKTNIKVSIVKFYILCYNFDMTKEDRLDKYLCKHVLGKLSLDELKSFCRLILVENPYDILDEFVCKNTEVKFEEFENNTVAETEYNDSTDKFDIYIDEKELIKFAEVDFGINITNLISTLAHEHKHAVQENILTCLDDVTIIDKYLIKLISSHNELFFVDHGAVKAYCDEIFADKSKKIRDYLFNSIKYGMYSNQFHEIEAEDYAQEYTDKLLKAIFENTKNVVVKDFITDGMGKNYKLLDNKSSRNNFEVFKSELLKKDVRSEIRKYNEQISMLSNNSHDSKKELEEKLKKIAILNDKIRCLLSLCDNDQKILILKHSLMAKESHCFEIVISFLKTEMYISKNNEHLIVRGALDLLRRELSNEIKERIYERLKNNCDTGVLSMIKIALSSERIIK